MTALKIIKGVYRLDLETLSLTMFVGLNIDKRVTGIGRKTALIAAVLGLCTLMTTHQALAQAKNTKPKPAKQTSGQMLSAASTEIASLSTQTLSFARDFGGDPKANAALVASRSYSVPIKSQWGVKLDVNQAVNGTSGWNDVDAGAYYKITPALKVGGTVGFGQKTKLLRPASKPAPKEQARVRVETSYRF